MPLDLQGTTLAQSPYYDDYAESKNFHRVLFKPSVAVQARELTQLQTILQNQIERFGDNVYRTGTIIKGCSLTTDTTYYYVKINDLQTTGAAYALSSLSNTYATETTTGLTALVVNYALGGQQLAPDMNTLYLKYLNTGTSGQKTFNPDSILKVYDRNYSIRSVEITAAGSGYSNTDYLVFTGGGGSGATANIVTTSTGAILTISITSSGSGYTTAPTITVANSSGGTSLGSAAVLNAINYLAQVQVANTSYGVAGGYSSNTTGIGTAIRTTDGVIYQKGHFVRVESHEVILSKYNTSANGVVVGFVTNESVVNSNADSTLLDNASGATNYTAPGADRLKLTANLVVYTAAAAASANGFLALYQYENGKVVKDQTATQFNSISKELNRRTYEESGNYVVRPFTTYSEAISGNSTHINVVVQPGIAYVEGNRVEILNNTRYPISKGTTYETSTTQSIATAFGGYVYVKEAAGAFNINTAASTVQLRSAYGTAITSGTTSTPGIQIGTARVRSYVYDSGTPGTPNCVYRLYLFDVRMASAGYSFKDVKCIIDGLGAQCDLVQDPSLGYSTQYDTDFDRMLFPSGTFAVRDFTSERVILRTSSSQTFALAGTIQVNLSGGATNPYSVGDLNSIQERDYIVIPQANVWFTSPNGGTAAYSSATNVITGTGTSFSAQYNVGDYIRVGTDTLLVTAITSNTSLQVSPNPAGSGSGVNHFTAFKQNVPINLSPSNRKVTINSSTQFTINLGGTLSSTAGVTVYYDYQVGEVAAPTIRTKTVNTYYVRISNTAVAASINGPWSLGIPDAVELAGVYIGTGTTYPDPSTSTDYASQFVLDSGQTDNYYGLASLKRRPGSTLSLGINNNLVVKFKAFAWGPGYYLSTESYTGAIDDSTTPVPANRIRTYQIPVYVSPKTGSKFDLRDSLDFRPAVSNTVTLTTLPSPWNNGTAVPVDPSTTLSFDGTDKLFPSPVKYFQAQISSYLARKDRVVIDKYGQVRVLSGIPSNSPSAPTEPEDAMTLAIMDIPQYPSLGAAEASEAGRPDLGVLATPVQNRRFTMKDIGDIESRISRLEYYSLLNTLETQTKQLVLPGETNNSIERFKNGFFVDPMTDYTISNIADPEYRILIDTNQGIARPYFYDAKINLQVNATSTNVVRKGDVVLLNHTSSALLQQNIATRDRSLVDKLWSYTGNLRTYPEFDNWHDTESRDTVITIDIYSPIADLAAATSAALSTLKGSAVLVRGPQDTGTATQVSGGEFGEQVWRQTTESLYKDTKVTLAGGAASQSNTTVGSFLNDITIQQYIRSQRIFFLSTGLRPGATHYVFFERDLMTARVTPHSVPLTTPNITRDSFTQIGALGSALVANSSGCVAGSIDIPASTYFIGERSVVLMDVDNLASESTATSRAIGRFSAFGISTASTNLSISTKTVDTAGSRGYNATTYFSETYPVAGERFYTRNVPWPNPDPLCQTFTVQPQTSMSDGVYLTAVDLYFKAKDSVQGVTVEIRETLNGVPTQTVLPFSRKYLPSASVNTSSNGSAATTFTFDSPVYVRTNTDYAVVIYPDSNSPEYRIFTSVVGQRDLISTNTIANQNWGQGTLFYSTSGTAWTPVQDEDLKFTLYRARFTSSTGTAVLNNGDYEFFTVANTSGTLRGGEDVAQLGNTYINVTLTSNNTTSVVNTSTSLTSTLASGDSVMILYGTATLGNTGSQSNVTISGTTVANASAGDTNTNFTTRYTVGQFVRFGNTTTGEIRQIVSIANATSMTIDAPIFGTSTNIQQYPQTMSIQVAKIASINTTAIVLNKINKASTSAIVDTGTIASMQKVVAGVVDSYNYSNNIVYISNSNAANSTFKFLANTSTYLATIIGDTSQATARVTSIDDLSCNFFTPLFSKVVVSGTSLGLTTNVTKSGGSTDSRVYELGMVNKFEFNDAAKVKSKSNEIVGTVINKSFTATVGFNAPTTSDDSSPMLDVNPIGMIITKNVIDNEVAEIVYSPVTGTFSVGDIVTQSGTGAVGTVVSVTSSNLVLKDVIGKFMARSTFNITTATANSVVKQVFDETTRFGRGKSKYISKRLVLADGMDAEDIKVFITAYKPLGTEVDVYARILNFTDGQAFEEKDWTRLDQVTAAGVYSDSLNDQDYREFEYTFPYTPPSIRRAGIVSTTNGSTTITGVDTTFTSDFVAGDLIKVVRTNTLTDYELLRVNSVANNTSLTTTTGSTVVAGVSGGTIELVTQPNAAFKYNKNSSIVRYHDSGGAAYDTYKYMAIKIVLRSPYTYLVPTVNDVRALAVSI